MMTNNRDKNDEEGLGVNGSRKHIIDFFISGCDGLILDFGPDRFKSAMEHLYEGEWAQFSVCAQKTSIPNATETVIDLYLNGVQIMRDSAP